MWGRALIKQDLCQSYFSGQYAMSKAKACRPEVWGLSSLVGTVLLLTRITAGLTSSITSTGPMLAPMSTSTRVGVLSVTVGNK